MKLFATCSTWIKAEAELEALVQEGIDSGPATEMLREDFDAIRRDIHAKHGRKGE